MSMGLNDFFDKLLTVRFTEDRKGVDIIDQTLIPVEIKRIILNQREEIWEAIKKLRVRGAPAIGVAAACGLAVLADKIETGTYEEFYKEFKKEKDYLATSRPTAVNLFWALNRMEKTVLNHKEEAIAEIKRILFEDAEGSFEESISSLPTILFVLMSSISKNSAAISKFMISPV